MSTKMLPGHGLPDQTMGHCHGGYGDDDRGGVGGRIAMEGEGNEH